MKMKMFGIWKQGSCADEFEGLIEAGTAASALRKYRKMLISSGEKTIVTGTDGEPKLVTSYGAYFKALPVTKP